MGPLTRAIGAISLASCLEPTQVTIELTSDACSSLADVEILLEGDAPVAQTNVKCQGDRIGSLVFIPSHRKDRFDVRVRAKGKSPGATCAGEITTDCIQANRSIAYVPHTPLVVPIALDGACRDRRCDVGSTCFAGDCVPSDVSNLCRDGVCRPPVPDAGTCAPPWFDPPGANALVWHFDSPMTTDVLGRCGPASIQTTPSMNGCGNAATDLGAMTTPLGCPNDAVANAMTFRIAAWVRVPQSIGSPHFVVNKLRSLPIPSGWVMFARMGNEIVFEGLLNGNATFSSLGSALTPGWHGVEVIVQAGTFIGGYLDMKKVAAQPMPARIGESAGAPVVVGSLAGSAIDELAIY